VLAQQEGNAPGGQPGSGRGRVAQDNQ